MLEAVAGYFSHIYITVDALDESTDREQILALLRTIITNPHLRHIHLLATSRKELDIERELSPIAVGLSLSNPYVDEDIRTYVKGRLLESPKFARWPESLKAETETALVKGAKGMFRWAFCQLDALKRLHTSPSIRLALTQLPKSLDETYERILCNIPPEAQNMVYRTLSFVASGQHDSVNVYELADILAVNVENGTFDRKDRPFDLYAPVEAATCLLTCDPESGHLSLSHYTVKEYLISPRIGRGPASIFQLTEDSMHGLVASCYILYMLHENYSLEQKTLMKRAIESWHYHIRDLESKPIQDAITPFVIRLLDPREPHYKAWKQEIMNSPMGDSYPLWTVEPGAECCAILASLCCLGFLKAARVLLDTQEGPFPFHVPLYWTNFGSSIFLKLPTEYLRKEYLIRLKDNYTGDEILTVLQVVLIYQQRTGETISTSIFELMISKGADINLCSLTGFSPLNTVLNYRSSHNPAMKNIHLNAYLHFFLTNGAQIDLSQCTITPLQSAIFEYKRWNSTDSFRAIETLLKSGARPNAVANDDVNIARIRATCSVLFRRHKNCSSVWLDESEYIKLALEDRGTSEIYDTPLRMLENQEKRLLVPADELKKLKILLIRYGGKSLHLFPLEGLQGYVEEDMKEWNDLKALDAATSSAVPLSEESCEVFATT
ncbi:hypothetical protein V8E51_005544 [Hyaloscypha variabilis]